MNTTKFSRSFWLTVGLLCIIAIAGGASREDSLAQAVVRTAAPFLAAAIIASGRIAEWRSLKIPIALYSAALLYAFVMVIPLPPSIWTELPGRGLIEPAAKLAGLPQPWRPIVLSPPLGWNALFSLIPPGSMLIALLHLRAHERAALLGPVVAIVMISASLGLLQLGGGSAGLLRWYAVSNPDAAIGLFANRNHHALLLAIGLALFAGWLHAKRGLDPLVPGRRASPKQNTSARSIGYLAAALMIMVTAFATGSRAGFVLVVVAIVSSIIAHRAYISQVWRSFTAKMRLFSAMSFGVLVLGIAALLIHSPQFVLVDRLQEFDNADDLRFAALPTLLGMAEHYFPIGAGFGSFEPAFRAAEPAALLSYFYLNEAHNDYLQVVIEGGLVGGLLIIAGFAWAAYRIAGTILWAASRDSHAGAAIAGATGVMLMLIASSVDYPLRTPFMMTMLVLCSCWMQLPKIPRGY